MKEEEKGYVYILTNPSFREDWVKIGKSSRPVDVRSKELDNTSVPLPFKIYATLKTPKYDKIEKEQVKEETHRPAVKGPEKGYRGFFEIGHNLGVRYERGLWNVSTTQGYQFNHYIFAGAGIGYHEGYDQNGVIFADGRFTLNKRHSVFADMKVGYAVLGEGDLYLSPTIGYRFGINSKLGAFVGLNYDLVFYDHNYSYYSSYTKKTTYYSERREDGDLYLRFGFEW